MTKIIPANGAQLYDAAVFNAQVPKEGPKAVPLQAPFTADDTEFVVSQLLTQAQQFITMIQGMYVDNSKNPQTLYVTTGVLNQTIPIKAGVSGYIPVLSPKNADITLRSSGETTVSIILLNVPVPAQLWDANETSQAYVAVAASSTGEALGLLGGAAGDFIECLMVVPSSVDADAITITDGDGSPITVFAGGTGSLSNLVPFPIPLGIQSTAGAWAITTGTGASVIVIGSFT